MNPQRQWKAITVATILLVPAYWALLIAAVSDASDDRGGAPNVAIALTFAIGLVPFVFVALAFLSQHPNPPRAVVRAMGTAALVGLPVSVMALDAVTGIVAGIGAGGAVALRREVADVGRARALAVVAAAVYTFVLVRVAGEVALLAAPIFPLTGLGLADHLVAWRRERAAVAARSTVGL